MPANTTFVPQSLKIRGNKKKVLAISQFFGVDYNKAQLQVTNNHATDIKNIVYRDKVNQKRKGWEQVCKINEATYYIHDEDTNSYIQKTNSTHFNGFHHFIGKDNKFYCIAHIGKLLFKVKNMGVNNTFLQVEMEPIFEMVSYGGSTYNVAKELMDIKSKAFVGNKCLYIAGGNKYYVVSADDDEFTIEEVEDHKDTYIPTTTIGITPKDSPVSGMTALDDINMMTEWRKNKLVSGTILDNEATIRTTRFFDYELDSNVVCKKPTDINNIKITISALREME